MIPRSSMKGDSKVCPHHKKGVVGFNLCIAHEFLYIPDTREAEQYCFQDFRSCPVYVPNDDQRCLPCGDGPCNG